MGMAGEEGARACDDDLADGCPAIQQPSAQPGEEKASHVSREV
jgi:hypothetical protein